MSNHVRMGVAFGCFVAALHLVWVLLVFTGLAQPLVNFIFWVHMLSVPVQVQPFDLGLAALVIGVTWCVAFAMGFMLSLIWSRTLGNSDNF